MTEIPKELAALAKELRGRSWEAAKRRVVSKVGSVEPDETFDDDVADAVFLRIQRNAQVGRYATEEILAGLGRNARRLEDDGEIALFRAAPPGSGIRPGDFATDSRQEAGYYMHGGHVVHAMKVRKGDVFVVDGSLGDGKEYVYLPVGYVPPEPVEHFDCFKGFYEASNGLESTYGMRP